MFETAHIQVRIADTGLRTALEGRLRVEAALDGRLSSGPPERGDIVVVLANEASPFECLTMSNQSLRPVVLASRWSDIERDRYVAAGAAYLEVELPPAGLVFAIQQMILSPD